MRTRTLNPPGLLLLASVAAVGAGAQELQPPACLNQLATPVYPPLARQARIEGAVELKFGVTAEGFLVDIATSGHPILAASAARLTEGIRLDPALCGSREFRVIYRYGFGDLAQDEVTTSVVYAAPDEFQVTIQGAGKITCTMYANVVAESMFRRTVRRILRR